MPILAPATDRRALLALIGGAIAIGAAPICVRLSALSPESVAFWRVLLATPMLLPLFLRNRHRPVSRRGWGLMLLAGLAFAADLAVWHYSIHYTSVANATLLANLAPVFVALVGVVFLREVLGARFALGLGLAIGGAAALVGVSFDLGGTRVLGDLLGVATAVFYAMYQLAISAVRREVDTWTLMFVSTAISAIALLPLALGSEAWWPADGREWALLLFLAAFSHAAGQGLIAYAFAHLPAALSSVSLLIQPLAAAAFAWLLLGEVIGPLQFAGALLVLIGIYICRLSVISAGNVDRKSSTAGR